MRGFALLTLVSGCSAYVDLGGQTATEKTYYYEGDWTYVGPGGSGAFTAMLVDPDDETVLYAGADVGGLYIYDPENARWVNITGAMKDLAVSDLAIAPAVGEVPKRLYVATNGGLYICETPSPTGCVTLHHAYGMGLPWTTYGDIFTNDDNHRVPLSAVAVDPADPTRVWVGTGNEPKPWKVDRSDYAKVFLSTNAGFTFSPVLKAPYGASSSTASYSGVTYTAWTGTAFDIVLDPEGSGDAWVSTDYGLFYTDDDGSDWARMGLTDRYCTDDAGLSWTDSVASPTACGSHSWPAISAGGVLPTTSPGTVELRQMATSVETEDSTDKLVLYAVVWDEHYAAASAPFPTGCVDTTDYFNDSSFTYYQGGAWRSEDRGATWTNVTTSDDAGWPTMRCGPGADMSTKSSWTATLFASIEVDPEVNLDADPPEVPQVFMGGVSNDAGLFRGQASGGVWSWEFISNPSLDPCQDSGGNCFEEDLSLGLAGTSNIVPVFDVALDWSVGANPIVYAGHSHGGWMGEWDSADQYNFSQLGSSWDTAGWDSHGLDDACVQDVAAPLTYDSTDHALLGIMDDGLLRGTFDGGAIVQWVSLSSDWDDAWEGDDWNTDDINSIAYDDGDIQNGAECASEGDAAAYVAHYRSAGSSVLKGGHGTSPPWRFWEVIGGFGHGLESDAATRTFDSALEAETDLDDSTVGKVYSLALDYHSCPDERQVLAGTDQGVFLYTPGAGWSAVSCSPFDTLLSDPIPVPAASGAGTCTVNEVLTDRMHHAFAWFVMNCSDDNGADGYDYEDYDGAYFINLHSGECYQLDPELSGSKVINAPESLALTTAIGSEPPVHSLLVGVRKSGRPKIYRATLDPDAPSTAITWSLVFEMDDMYGSVPMIQDGALDTLRVGEIEMDPHHRNDVTAALIGNNTFDGYNPDFVVRTVNAGDSWQPIDPTGGYTNGLPSRSTRLLRFDEDGEWLYHGSCASLYRGEVN